MAQTLAFEGVQAPTAEIAAAEQRSGLAAPRALISLSTALLVCVLAALSIRYLCAPHAPAALWVASGVAVIGWLSGPRRREFDLAYGFLTMAAVAIANFLFGKSANEVFTCTIADFVEVGSAVWMIRRFTPPASTASLAGLLKFLLLAPLIAPFLSGLVAAALLAAQTHRSFPDVLLNWQLGHTLGLEVIAPLGLQLVQGRLTRLPRVSKTVEGALILGAVTALSALVFYHSQRAVGFMSVPLILAAAIRLRMPGAALAILIATGFAITGTLHASGAPLLAHVTIEQRVHVVQLYLLFSTLPALPVAALLDERDRLAASARAGQAAAEAASAGKSRLLANVSHEIKSPVAGIIGIGELWSAGRLGPVSPMQQEMAEMLVRTARQVEALAYDLLDVSQAEAGAVAVRLAPVDLSILVDDVRRTVSMRPEAQPVRIVVEHEAENPRVTADSVRLTQVLTNLTVNAVKYGACGGVVILRLERPYADVIRVSVIDRGPGIPLEKQSQLFEPFNRLGMERTTIEGNGIGLTLARRLTELQGGRIGFESRPGDGARFWVDLPAA
jgi:signal transduction histidine kinase